MPKTKIEELLDRTQAVLPDGKDVKPLAEFLGKRYAQVWEWVIGRSCVPNGDVTLRILEWTERRENEGKRRKSSR